MEIDGQKLLDGGISDSIPVSYFESIGYDRNVVILTRPLGYRKKRSRVTEAVIARKYRQYPELVEAMKRRYRKYNEQVDEIMRKEAAGGLLVIRPKLPLPVGRVEKDPETCGYPAISECCLELTGSFYFYKHRRLWLCGVYVYRQWR